MAGDQYLKDGYSLSALDIYTGTCVFSYKVFLIVRRNMIIMCQQLH